MLSFLTTEKLFYEIIKRATEIYLPFRLNRDYNAKSFHKSKYPKQVIYMADGKARHGGLSDRLRAIVSLFESSIETQSQFKIFFTNPFRLENFLVVNHYDWVVSQNDIIYSKINSKPIVVYSTLTETSSAMQAYKEKERVENKIKNNKQIQLHFYSNVGYGDSNFKKNFDYLFKPSPSLQFQLDLNLSLIGTNYISIVFRFQNLLGDFFEGNYPVLKSTEDKEILISKCINAISKIHNDNPETKKILVTSDSDSFINAVNNISYIYTIPGKIVHMDYTDGASDEVYMKSFVDLFMLSKSEKVYLVRTPLMLKSGFAYRASLLGGIPYKEIELN